MSPLYCIRVCAQCIGNSLNDKHLSRFLKILAIIFGFVIIWILCAFMSLSFTWLLNNDLYTGCPLNQNETCINNKDNKNNKYPCYLDNPFSLLSFCSLIGLIVLGILALLVFLVCVIIWLFVKYIICRGIEVCKDSVYEVNKMNEHSKLLNENSKL